MFTGLPDFGRPRRSGDGEGFAVFEQPAATCIVPDRLRTEPLQIDTYLQDRDGRIERFTLVSAAFRVARPLDEPGLRPVPLRSGQARLVAPAALRVPGALLTPRPCDAATGATLPLLIRLDDVAGDLLTGALRGGLRTLGAVFLVTVAGVAARCPGALTVDADALLAAVGEVPVPPEELLARVRDGMPGIATTGGPDDARLLATAIVDRIVARLAVPAFPDAPAGEPPAADTPDGGWLFGAAPPPATTLTWSLNTPVETTRLARLACDPIVGTAAPEALLREHVAAPLTDGAERVIVHHTLPADLPGVVAATATLTAPAAPPARPFAVEALAVLEPRTPTPVTLRLAPGEALDYHLRGVAVVDTDRGPITVGGPARRLTGDPGPIVAPADLGLRLIPIHATRGLLALADVAVTARARLMPDGALFTAVAAPTREEAGEAWLAIPLDATDVTLHATATTRGPRGRTVAQELPDAAIWLDPFSFTDPTWDPWRDPSAPDIPDTPQEEDMLVVETGGLRAAGRKDDEDWRFLPLSAGPARLEDGSPQLNLIEAGDLAMLMVTTALKVTDEAQAQVRHDAHLAGAADDVQLSPVPFTVAGPVELILTRDGTPHTLATALPSGTVTQEAAFGITLDAADLPLVRRALDGEAGLLAVRYQLRITASDPLGDALSGGPGTLALLTDASTWRA